jgi:uncharacterized protein YbjT (DUF2867 family)
MPALWAQPALVLLLRHAEKPAEESDVHLSARGRERAEALVALLTTNAPFVAHGMPVAVYAPRFEGRRHSRRPFETIAPLARRLGLKVQQPYRAEDYAALAREVLDEPAYRGKTVVICWVRESLPELARALGVKSEVKNWKSEVYDRVWAVIFRPTKVTLKRYPQRLLPGDEVD